MKLSDAHELSLEEASVYLSDMPILEDGEGPRWKFRYDRFKVDPTPDILLLGAYRHPNTGNDLVGGINLHYLNKQELDKLATALPQIMKAGNLYRRYWAGRQLVPGVFNDYYRTYNADYIRGVDKDIMYPKYGFLKTARDWLKKKISGLFKTKAQRQKEAEPEYPDDLEVMQNKLDRVVQDLQQQPEVRPGDEPPETPEMRRARENFLQYQREKAARDLGFDDTEDELFKRAHQDLVSGEEPTPPETEPEENPAKEFEDKREENRRELLDPDNEIDLEESIIYFSPVAKRYIVEKV